MVSKFAIELDFIVFFILWHSTILLCSIEEAKALTVL